MSQLLFDSPTAAAGIPDTGGTDNITCSEIELFSTPKLAKRNKVTNILLSSIVLKYIIIYVYIYLSND